MAMLIHLGSNDGGKQIHDDHPRVNKTMQEIGKILNLREHGAGRNCVKVCGPGDLEVHYGVCLLLFNTSDQISTVRQQLLCVR